MVDEEAINSTAANLSERSRTVQGTGMQVELRIALYIAIFVLSVSGNSLVALTIAQNRRMRTLTNVMLMNLSIADLLLAAFCMPFTLIPTLLQDFIFGPVVCVLVRYMQGSFHIQSFTSQIDESFIHSFAHLFFLISIFFKFALEDNTLHV